MHECFERIFCELKWRKEVNANPYLTFPSALVFVIQSLLSYVQVEEEATDKDNKNCSKDGMCGKVRLCLPLSRAPINNFQVSFSVSCSFFLCKFARLSLATVSVAEYFPAAEAQKGWRHVGREIIAS